MLEAPQNVERPKVFGIGYNKTGTTSLDAIFRHYNYNVPVQVEQELEITEATFSGSYEPFKNFVSQYEAFQDLPFSQGQTYIVADVLFPHSKFILTERNPEEWFDSLYNFHKTLYGLEDLTTLTEEDILYKFQYLTHDYAHKNVEMGLTSVENGEVTIRWDLIYNKNFYISEYVKRNNDIKKYFRGREDSLLVFDFKKEKDTRRICEFLNLPPDEVVDIPHLNQTALLSE